jgi:hypothetical protein
MAKQTWVLFNSQLPASPSSPRVMVWRRMRAAGAVNLQNGVWILPYSQECIEQAQALLTYVKEQGGSGHLFVVNSLTEEVEADVWEQFEVARRKEYIEFLEHCRAFLTELKREKQAERSAYSKLEESKATLKRLFKWLPSIQARDFWGHEMAATAVAKLQACQQALENFTRAVYLREDNLPG